MGFYQQEGGDGRLVQIKTCKAARMTTDEKEDLDFNKHERTGDKDQSQGAFVNNRIGPIIRQARLALGMTQNELAERSGISKSRLAEIEIDASEAKMITLRKIIEVGLNGRIHFSIKLN